MRLLLDHCVPAPLAALLTPHHAALAADMGWEELTNGRLLAAAAQDGFHAVITVDKNMLNQQNPATFPLAVVVVRTRSNDIDTLKLRLPAIFAVLENLQPRCFIEVGERT